MQGKGWAYGSEFLIRKTKGKTTGWVSYTLSWSKRQFDEINNGKEFYARNDRRNDISVVVNQKIKKRISASLSWVYYTGSAVSFPTGIMEVGGTTVPIYSERNADRMAAYHRMDASVTLAGKEGKKFQSSWNFAIYNLYARKNPYAYQFRESKTDPGKQEVKMLYLFGIVPSISYNLKF